jgi:hypothetical protein
MDATQPAQDRIMSPIQRRLSAATDQLQRRVVKAHVTERPIPALDRSTARLIATMRASARTAVAQTPGLSQGDVRAALAWRIAKVKALSKIIKAADNPALGVMVALAQQAAKFGSDLNGKVSDALVSQHTQRMQDKCGPGEVLIWQPERNACVRCLKYAGQYRTAAGEFKAGQSFDPSAPRTSGTLPGPPLHDHCRCELAVIPAREAPDNSAALHREAMRSVLKGWALPSESDAVRTRAAQALLNSNVIAPKSVIAETRRRLKSGQPFIQDVP